MAQQLTDFSENTLVEQPAIALFGELGYATANCFYEKVGTTNATLGRETTADVILVPKLKAALKKLNPDVAEDAIRLAVEELTKDRSAMSRRVTWGQAYPSLSGTSPGEA